MPNVVKATQAGRAVYRFDGYTLNTDSGTLSRGDEIIPLRPKAWSCLVYLVRHQGKLVSRHELIGAVWPNAVISDDSLTQCIVEIRRAIDDGERAKLRTVARRGFVFELPVTAGEVIAGDRRPARDGRRLAIAALAIAAVGLAVWGFGHLAKDMPASAGIAVEKGAAPTAPRPEAILVLPLVNLSGVADNVYFTGGLYDEILVNLSQIEDLRVISRTTAVGYVNSTLSLEDIGRQLRARFVVEGSVRRIENHVRITVQLYDAVAGAQLWARQFDRELRQVFATQSELAREISTALRLEIRPETVPAPERMPTNSVKAYQLYTQATSIARSEILSESALRRERALLEEAVSIDPDFVEAWACLKRVLDETVIRTVVMAEFGETDAERERFLAETVRARTKALETAVALDPDNLETVLALASEDFLTEQQPGVKERRKRFIDRAIEMAPENAEAWRHLAWYLKSVDEIASATHAFLKALELDPLYARNVDAAWFHFRGIGDEAMTARLAERLKEIAPDLPGVGQLARIPSSVRLNNIAEQFRISADESVIEQFAETLNTEREAFTTWAGQPDLALQTYETYLMALEGRLDELADLRPLPLPESFAQHDVSRVMEMNYLVLAARHITGRDDAIDAARRVLEMRDRLSIEPGFPEMAAVFAAAEAIGGDAWPGEMSRDILDADADEATHHTNWYFVALAYNDVDRAVDELLSQAERHPGWPGTDWIAIDHVRTRHLLLHPDMQAYYVDEGKWLGYLAARVPGYAQYLR